MVYTAFDGTMGDNSHDASQPCREFPIVPTRLVIAQRKQNCPEGGNCSDDSPVVAIRYVSGVLKITHQIGPHQTTLYQTQEELRNQWLDFKFQIRFSTNANGRIKAWLNDKAVVDYKGVNAYPENEQTGYTHPGWFYFKMGLYRDLMAEPMTIYIDEYRKKNCPKSLFNSRDSAQIPRRRPPPAP